MKETGIIRPIDELGRIVLPKEIRKNLNLNTKDGMEIYTEGERIILKKHMPNCIFCGSDNDLINFQDKLICPACLGELKSR